MRPCLVLFAILSAAAPAQEQPPVMRTLPDSAAPPRVGVGITQRKLSLKDTLEMALSNNLDIEIERTNRDTAAQSVQAARGFFDPSFRWQPLFNVQNTPTGSVLQGATGKLTDRGLVNNFYLRQKFERFGTVAQLDFENSRNTTTNPFTSFSPLLNSRLAVNFTQPLLRGLRIDSDRAELRIRRKRVDLSDIELETRVIDVIFRVQQSYWDLVAARQDVAVKEENVNWAREQLAVNQRLVKAGTLAPVELAAREAELQRRLDTLYSAVGALTEIENQLKTQIAAERVSSLWNDEIIPIEAATIEPPDAEDVRASVQTALKRRPELKGISVQRQINDVSKELNRDLTKPEVSFVGQYSLTGLGGTILQGENPFTASNVVLYQRLNQLSTAAGLQPLPRRALTLPRASLSEAMGRPCRICSVDATSLSRSALSGLYLRNRTAEANLGQTLISEKRIKLEQARLEQNIEAQVRTALQGIQTARQRITAAEASARAAKEKLDSETRLFQTGESTNFLVLTRQNEYADSRRREVVARLDFNKSVARLEQALGITLSAHNITFTK